MKLKGYHLIVLLSICLACGGSGGNNSEPPPKTPKSSHDTNSEDLLCVDGTFLTYSTYAQDFFQRYCLMCHSSSREGSDRYGAGAGFDFDTYDLVASYNEDILSALIGEAANMPPSQSINALDLKLMEEWLTCGFPQ